MSQYEKNHKLTRAPDKRDPNDCRGSTFSDMDKIEELLQQSLAVQAETSREVARYNDARKELNEVLTSLVQPSCSSQVVLMTNFPGWLSEAAHHFSRITSDVPQILQALDKLDLDSATEKLAALETNWRLGESAIT